VGHLLLDSHNNQALEKKQILQHLANALKQNHPLPQDGPFMTAMKARMNIMKSDAELLFGEE
jgi:ribosomal protein L39E